MSSLSPKCSVPNVTVSKAFVGKHSKDKQCDGGKRAKGFMGGSVYQRKCSGIGCTIPKHQGIKASHLIFLSHQMDTVQSRGGGETGWGSIRTGGARTSIVAQCSIHSFEIRPF